MAELRFQGAAYEYWGDAPSTCPREGCDGMLRRVSDGYACLLCGRSYIVAQALAQLMNLDRWASDPSPDERLKIDRRVERRRNPKVLSGKIKRARGDPR